MTVPQNGVVWNNGILYAYKRANSKLGETGLWIVSVVGNGRIIDPIPPDLFDAVQQDAAHQAAKRREKTR